MYPTLRDMQKLQESDVPLDNPRSILYDNSNETKGRSLAADEEKRLTTGMVNTPWPEGAGLVDDAVWRLCFPQWPDVFLCASARLMRSCARTGGRPESICLFCGFLHGVREGFF